MRIEAKISETCRPAGVGNVIRGRTAWRLSNTFFTLSQQRRIALRGLPYCAPYGVRPWYDGLHFNG